MTDQNAKTDLTDLADKSDPMTEQDAQGGFRDEADFRHQTLIKNFSYIFDNSKDIMNLFSLSQQKVIAQNKPSFESTGYTVKDLETTPITQFYPPEELPKLFASLERLVRDGAGQERLRMYFRDGSLRDIWVRSFIIQREPEMISLVHTIDVTEETRRGEQAIQAAKLATLGEVNAVLAHELKNSIQSLQSSLLLLGEDKNSYMSPFGCDRIKAAKSAATQMENVIRNIGSYLKGSAPDLAVMSLPVAIKEVTEFLYGYLFNKQIRVSVFIKPDLPLIMASQGQVQQVIVNLLKNAAQAMEGCQSRLLEIVAEKNINGTVTLSIRDTGRGIAASIRDRIFDAFTTTKSGTENFGLGLSLVRRLCEANGISLAFDSEIDVGTEFRLTFAAPGKERGEDGESGLGGRPNLTLKSLLLISEASSSVALAKELSEAHGIQTIIVRSPGEAMSVLATEAIGAVACDADLFPISGDRLAEELAKTYFGPICVLGSEKKVDLAAPGKGLPAGPGQLEIVGKGAFQSPELTIVRLGRSGAAVAKDVADRLFRPSEA